MRLGSEKETSTRTEMHTLGRAPVSPPLHFSTLSTGVGGKGQEQMKLGVLNHGLTSGCHPLWRWAR